MSQEELTGKRDMTYSAWHRRQSTRRFVGIEKAQLLSMIDLDAALYVEYDNGTKEPLALIETAVDVGQEYKTATVTKKLAERASLPGFVLLYKISSSINPADEDCFDIEKFRVKRINPPGSGKWVDVSPSRWANFLLKLRNGQAKLIDTEYSVSLMLSDSTS